MKIFVAAATLALLAGPAMAQSTQSSQNSPANQNSPASQTMQTQNSQTNAQSSQRNMAAAQKIKQDLQKEGFTDVKVVAESFVVQGKSPDGDPVLMTIGPHGMSVFEAVNANGSPSSTVGSNSGSSGSSGMNSTGKTTSGTQKSTSGTQTQK